MEEGKSGERQTATAVDRSSFKARLKDRENEETIPNKSNFAE
jgi:hypothetical protein